MKKIFYKLFVGIGVVLMLIYYTVTAALCYPFHSLKYRRSAFFLETGIPFSAAKDTSDLRFFQIFREAGIPIRYLPPKDLKRSNGWFLLGAPCFCICSMSFPTAKSSKAGPCFPMTHYPWQIRSPISSSVSVKYIRMWRLEMFKSSWTALKLTRNSSTAPSRTPCSSSMTIWKTCPSCFTITT